MIDVFQVTIDCIKQERELGYSERGWYDEDFQHILLFIEKVTGKKVEVKNWKAELKGE